MRFSDKLHNSHYRVTSLLKCSHLLDQCHQGLWITQVNLIMGNRECFQLFLCNQYCAGKSAHAQQRGKRVQALPGVAFLSN